MRKQIGKLFQGHTETMTVSSHPPFNRGEIRIRKVKDPPDDRSQRGSPWVTEFSPDKQTKLHVTRYQVSTRKSIDFWKKVAARFPNLS
jgi:hypothetical protein